MHYKEQKNNDLSCLSINISNRNINDQENSPFKNKYDDQTVRRIDSF